jgi:hypothetical protein
MFLSSYVSGSATTLADQDFDFAETEWIWVRAQIIGTALKTRYWKDGTAEPETWNVELTNTSIASGSVGWFSYDGLSDQIDYYAVGTGSDPAPSPVVGGSYTVNGTINPVTVAGITVWNSVMGYRSLGQSASGTLGPLLVYPYAEGFGIASTAGRDAVAGKIYRINTLDDNSNTPVETSTGSRIYTSSFRAACEAVGPRTIIFDIGGVIRLKDQVEITNPYLTIAGQTAPGQGIMIRDFGLGVTTHDILIQHIAIRVGDEQPSSFHTSSIDGFIANGAEAYNIIIDRCSISWGVDENMDAWKNVSDFTVSNCIIAEGLEYSWHSDGSHSKGFLVGPEGNSNIAYIKNLHAMNEDRSVLVYAPSEIYIANNIFYAHGNGSYTAISDGWDTGLPTKVSTVGNIYKNGPESTAYRAMSISTDCKPGTQVYEANSYTIDYPDRTVGTGAFEGVRGGESTGYYVETPPITIPGFTPITAQADIWDYVIANAGARAGNRDTVDTRIAQQAVDQTGSFVDTVAGAYIHPRFDSVTLGSELITVQADREFSSDTGFWVKYGSGTTIADGTLNCFTSGTQAGVYRDAILTYGSKYQVTFTIGNYTGGSEVGLAIGPVSGGYYLPEAGTYTIQFIHNGSVSGRLGLWCKSPNVTFDNISLKEITGGDDGIVYPRHFTETADDSVTYAPDGWPYYPTEFATDFSEYPTGQQPYDWTKRLYGGAATCNYTVEEVAGVGKVLQLSGMTAEGLKGITWNAFADTTTDVEVLVKFRVNDANTAIDGIGPYVRATGTTSSTRSWYWPYFASEDSRVLFTKWVPDPVSIESQYTYAFTETEWIWCRYRVIGTDHKLKYWKDGETEPETWTHEVTDTGPTAGYVGWMSYDGRADQIAFFSVGLDGATAPSTVPTAFNIGEDPFGDDDADGYTNLEVLLYQAAQAVQ